MMTSLKKRLLLILLALTLFAWVGSAMLTFSYASRVMLDQVDRQLEQYADLVSYITEVFGRQLDQGLAPSEPALAQLFRDSRGDAILIPPPGRDELVPALNIFMDGRLLAALEDSPQFPAPTEAGFASRSLGKDGGFWRLFSRYHEPTELWILVGIEIDAARWDMLGTLGQALTPLLIILPLTLALFYFGVSRGLRPVQDLAEQIARRSPGLLDPVANERVPEELRPVVAELNELLDRLAQALDAEQRFTANAAHELLTPLAAIKTEVQLCQRQVREEQGRLMLDRIAQRVDRAGHTVEQLLTLARLDPDAPLPRGPVPLAPLVREILAETGHLAADRGLRLELVLDEGSVVHGDTGALAILLRNLFINAFRYATENSQVQVELQRSDSAVSFELCNDCAALSAAEYQRIFDRFYRIPGSAGQGAGLGLSIVGRIATLHDAEFSAGPNRSGAGFCVRLVFPA